MAIFIAELFGFLVMLFVLYRYVWPLVAQMAETRQAEIARQVEEAEEAEKARAEAQRRHDSAVASAEEEAARIRDDARSDSTRIREELTEQAEQEVARIRQRGEEQLAAQRENLARGLRAEVGAQAMELAGRIVNETYADEGQRSASVDSFLEELDVLDAGPRQAATTRGGAN